MDPKTNGIDEHYLRLWVDLGLRELEGFLHEQTAARGDGPSDLDSRPAGA
jgi:hypothetical protein